MEDDGNNSIVAKEKLDQVATWVGSTVSSAFFSSLERFSCVNVTTDDDDEEEEGEADSQDAVKNPPLTVTDQSQSQTQAQAQNDVAKLPV
ncbi:uncharacterized protein LOC133778685 [Humulus lupulus]|uniref:uncharacterized protein LOC133778685 n=1 Tax=Humulus lupulus TaxID=3486 RepID=UPI002B410096|nr:uncharacterized protein LOC133778685 [Humulus lupulus]